jgi:drug/metabolite transporter (DMT)-like permease
MPPLVAGIIFKVSSTIAFAFMVTVIKLASASVPSGEVLFARSFFGIIPVIVYLIGIGEFPRSLGTRHPFGHVRRSVVGTLSMFAWFFGIARLPLPDATAISYSGPLFGVCFAALLLGERVRIFRWSAVTVGFFGVLIVLSEQISGLGAGLHGPRAIGAAMVLASAVLGALATVTVRSLTATETTGAIVFYFSLSGTVFSLLTVPAGWVMPDGKTAVLLVAAGLFGGVGQVLMTQSYRLAEASVIAPFDYINMIWIVILAYAVFGDVPSLTVLFGSLIVISSGVFVIWRESRLGVLQAKAKAQSTIPPG